MRALRQQGDKIRRDLAAFDVRMAQLESRLRSLEPRVVKLRAYHDALSARRADA